MTGKEIADKKVYLSSLAEVIDIEVTSASEVCWLNNASSWVIILYILRFRHTYGQLSSHIFLSTYIA